MVVGDLWVDDNIDFSCATIWMSGCGPGLRLWLVVPAMAYCDLEAGTT